MHETVFAKRIITEAQKHGTVKAISLEIGELAHVPPEELLECLRQLVPWSIDSKVILAKVRCSCGFVGHPTILERGHDHFFIECPSCAEIPDLTEGTEIKIVNVTVK